MHETSLPFQYTVTGCARSLLCWPKVQWAKGSLNISDMTVLDYYRDPRVRLLFKANMCRMVNR